MIIHCKDCSVLMMSMTSLSHHIKSSDAQGRINRRVASIVMYAYRIMVAEATRAHCRMHRRRNTPEVAVMRGCGAIDVCHVIVMSRWNSSRTKGGNNCYNVDHRSNSSDTRGRRP